METLQTFYANICLEVRAEIWGILHGIELVSNPIQVESVSVIDIDLIKGGYDRGQPEFQLAQVFFAMLIKQHIKNLNSVQISLRCL